MGAVRSFMDRHFLHFNSRVTVEAARAWEAHVAGGGKMFVSLAGAMSTAEIGRVLSRAIREGLVHGISCTGANLEEDVFNLLAGEDYEIIPNWRGLSAADEEALYARGMNRVTDTCIPETVMRHVEQRIIKRWAAAAASGEPRMPADFVWEVLGEDDIDTHFQRDPNDSWVLAAKECGVPIWTPGWEDSTLGNVYTAEVMRGNIPGHGGVVHGTEQMQRLMEWYKRVSAEASVGFFQVGGGIAGDFAICAVPALIQDLCTPVPFWGYFAQITDAVTSYGGYSGAPPNEKITWGKLAADTPKFMIESDASIVFPLILAYLLGE